MYPENGVTSIPGLGLGLGSGGNNNAEIEKELLRKVALLEKQLAESESAKAKAEMTLTGKIVELYLGMLQV